MKKLMVILLVTFSFTFPNSTGQEENCIKELYKKLLEEVYDMPVLTKIKIEMLKLMVISGKSICNALETIRKIEEQVHYYEIRGK